MEKEEIKKSLEKIIPKDKIKQEELMKNHTSFKIGGAADFFVKISTIEELRKVLEFVQKNNIPITIIGNGSNLLVTDKGIKGIVAKIDMKEIKIEDKNNQVEVITDSGVPIGLLAQKLLNLEITGFEEISGIPGTMGGAITMNAGAHGKELKDITEKVIAMDFNGKIHEFTKEQCEFQYRKSKFIDERYIILQIVLKLEKGKKENIKQKMEEYSKYRKEKQPIEYPSAGSTFKRGKDYITAQLIDQAGLKGYSIGDAQVSEKHAGFIINKGNATAKDVLELVKYITEKVYEKFGKKIKLEIQIIGE